MQAGSTPAPAKTLWASLSARRRKASAAGAWRGDPSPGDRAPGGCTFYMGRLPGGAAAAGELVRVRRGEKAAVRFRPVPHPGNGESIKKFEGLPEGEQITQEGNGK